MMVEHATTSVYDRVEVAPGVFMRLCDCDEALLRCAQRTAARRETLRIEAQGLLLDAYRRGVSVDEDLCEAVCDWPEETTECEALLERLRAA